MSDLRAQWSDALLTLQDAGLAYEQERTDLARILAALTAERDTLKAQLFKALHPADVYVTVGSTPYATSQFRTGMQDVDASLRLGSQGARDKLAAVMQVMGTHVMNFGAPNLWPDPAIVDVAKWNWARLDQRLAMFIDMGAEPALVFYNYPWWMKEIVDATGAHALDGSDPFTTNGRVMPSKRTYLGVYCHEIAKRYLTAGVRTLVFGNELKGYYVRRDGQKGYDIEEYTDLYNGWVLSMEQAARDVGIDPAALKLGGPYAPIRTVAAPSSETVPTTHPLYGKPYGEYRYAPIKALEYWLDNASRADFVCFDMGSGNAEGGELVDTFTVQASKYADVMRWLRTQTSLPIVLTEVYPKCADDGNANPQRVAAAKLVAHLSMVEAGYSGAWQWGAIGQGEDDVPNGGLLTGYGDSDSAHPWYDAYALIRQHFCEGAQLYPVMVEGEGVYAKCADGVTVVVNMTDTPKTVCVGETVQTVAPYAWQALGRG